MSLLEKWNRNKFNVYESEEKTVLELIDDIENFNTVIVKEVDTKTDLNGDHKGTWQGISRPTMSEEGMRGTVEKIIDEDIPLINEELQQIKEIDIVSINEELGQKTNEEELKYKSGAELLTNTLNRLNTGKYINIAGIGDSIMAGYYANNNNGYMEILTSTLRNKFGVSVTLNNQAISGYTVRDSIIDGKLSNIDNNRTDLYIISFGHNDIKSGLSSYYIPGYGYELKQSISDTEYIIRRLRVNHPNADIILLGQPPYTSVSIESNTVLANYTNELKGLAIKYNCLFIDLAPLFFNYPDYDNALMYDGGHPNEQGHRLIAQELMKYFITETVQNTSSYEVPTTSLNELWRYSNVGWKQLSTEGINDRFKFFGSSWNDRATTSSGNYVDIVSKCNCIAVKIEITENTILLIAKDSLKWFDRYTFTNDYPTSFWLTIPFNDFGDGFSNELTGLHSARLFLRSGYLKIVEVWSLDSSHNYIPCDSTTLTLSSNISISEADNSTQINTYGNKRLVPSVNDGYSITIPFIGTGLAIDCQIRSALCEFTVRVDGVVAPDLILWDSTSMTMQGSRLICNRLPFGQHTVTLTAKTGNTSVNSISGFTVLDERKLEHPINNYGFIKVGETKTFTPAYYSTPFISTFGNGIYPTSQSKSGFTLNGVSGEMATYKTEGNRLVY